VCGRPVPRRIASNPAEREPALERAKETSCRPRRKGVARKKTTSAKRTRAPRRDVRHSAYQLGDADVEHFLVSGEYRGLLEEYFGEKH
jgi:hypothetical protein